MTQEGQTARSTRVLILDEDRVEGGMLAFHLRREGLVVMLMTNAEEASDAIAWAEPDVLLVEVAAQGFDGREFLGQLAHLPVDVFAVADRQLPAEVELDALRLGVIDIMMKPIDPVTLARRLKSRPERTRRGSMAGLPEGGISGDQAVHSVVHLLQMAHRHRLNARLHTEIDGDWAVLLVRHGEVIDAEAPSATGREAAFQMVRATHGAFVLFPLPPEAEELSRDDVIRADLATLVADAMGRREPRTVNVVKVREQELFVLPHVGSPRAPLAKRGSDETLEYAAADGIARISDGARVRRPGEREREQAEVALSPSPAVAGKPLRQPTRPMQTTVTPAASATNSGPTASELALRVMDSRSSARPETTRPVTDQGVGTSSQPSVGLTVVSTSPGFATRTEGPFGGRSPIESPTVDEGFDESTDQEEKRRPRAGHTGASKRPGKSGPATGSGLRRVAGGSAAAIVNERSGRRPTDPEMAAIGPVLGHEQRDERRNEKGDDERSAATGRFGSEEIAEASARYADEPGRGRRGPRVRGERRAGWSLPTMVMAGAAVVLAIFIVARIATRETPVVVNVDADPTLKLGQALVDLDEGRRDAARTALATLAIDQAAPSEVLAALAKMHYQDRRLAEAQALVERWVERNPMEPEALAWLGLVQAERKDMPRAAANFEKALQGARGDLAERLKWLVPKPPVAPAPAPAPPTPTEGVAPGAPDPAAAPWEHAHQPAAPPAGQAHEPAAPAGEHAPAAAGVPVPVPAPGQ